LLAEHDAASGALIREVVWLDDLPLALVSGAVAAPSYSWITSGHLGEPLLLTNAAGAVTASTTRDPWGNAILLTGGEPLNLGYPGQWQDPATGLYQNWHRDYDPTLGRYLQADPLGLGGGSNLYAYVGGDPVNAVDPEGLKQIDWFTTGPFGLISGAGDALHAANNPGRNPFCFDVEDFLLEGALILALGPEYRGAGLLGKLEIKGGVYALRDRDGSVMRTGRSIDLMRRAGDHRRDPLLKGFPFEVIYQTDDYALQRALEQVLHETHRPIFNKINPISPRNREKEKYMKAAQRYLKGQ
jgi:RHS repeat-associated protein